MRRAIPELRSGELSVAVISPYKAQVKLLRELFATALGAAAAKGVDVNTIDGFQGREKDVVIFSCVRSSDPRRRRGIGFVADERRVNVGLTRARCALLVVGNARSLCVDARWRNLVAHALARGCAWAPGKPPADAFLEAAAKGEAGPLPDTAAARERLGLGGPGDGAAADAADAAGARGKGGKEGKKGGSGGGGGDGGGDEGGEAGGAAVGDFYGADTVVDDAWFGAGEDDADAGGGDDAGAAKDGGAAAAAGEQQEGQEEEEDEEEELEGGKRGRGKAKAAGKAGGAAPKRQRR